MTLELSQSVYVWYVLYLATVASFLLPTTRATIPFFFTVLIGFGLLFNVISVFGATVAIAGLALGCWTPVSSLSAWLRWWVIGLVSLLLALHLVEGFSNTKIYSSRAFGESGLPFQLYLNIDKSLAALIVLNAFGHKERWRISLNALVWIIFAILAFFLFALVLGATTDLKLSVLTLQFAVLNLMTTCLAEEAFFRLMIQNQIAQRVRVTSAYVREFLPIVLTAVVFTLAHFHVTEGYVLRLLLIFSAGLIYGLIYSRFGLGAAVFVHFLINIIHFIFFAYPATFQATS